MKRLVCILSPALGSLINGSKNQTTLPRSVVREPFKLDLLPYVSIGVEAVRSGPRHDPPPGYRVVCPSDRAYCIDYQSSDNGTCMYPDPLEIKRCYDNSCTGSAWAPVVRRQQGEDTYCKDFMTPQGRVCQWLDSVPCSCEARSIYYYSGEFVAPGEPVPYGFAEVFPCTYPLDVIRRAAEEAARKAKRDQRKRRQRRRGVPVEDDYEAKEESSSIRNRQKNRQQDDSGVESHVLFVATVFALLATIWSM
jgi:hypothetical protein